MSTETKDAPAKTPSKGFSLRSRLLGIPAEGTPEAASSDSETGEAAPAAAEPVEETQAAPVAAEQNPAPNASVASDDTEEDEEPPRVGVAVTPKRSLLSMAFGISDKKAKAEKAKFDETAVDEPAPVAAAAPEPAEIPEPVQEEAAAPEEAAPIAIEEPVVDEAPVAAAVEETVVEAPIEAPPVAEPPKSGRLFSLLRGTPKPAPEAREAPAAPAPEAPSAVIAEPEPEIAPLPSPIDVEEKVAAPTPFVRFSGVTKTYDGVNLVVKGLDLDIARGEFLTLLGPSGSGKTTTLMMLAGFEQPTAGDILLNGTTLTELPPHKRGLGFVFQNYALFPHMTVQENVAFPLEVRRIRTSEVRERVARALSMVELTGFEKRKPQQLSGGQQQRVAMARALVFDPELVLMDEPLGALDKHLREQMQYELKRLHRELGVTVVYVTHDQSEALTLSDRIAVFHEGIIQQLDTPSRIYQEPSNAFVAGFIGENNALPGKVVSIKGDECVVELIGGSRVRAFNGNCETVGQTGVVCVRPENLSISAETTPGGNHVAALIEDFIFHGDHVRVKLSAPGMSEIYVKTPARSIELPAKGVAVTLCWEPAFARAFAS
jgi:putative spermidine/putrescine transport system ATP-binding protein